MASLQSQRGTASSGDNLAPDVSERQASWSFGTTLLARHEWTAAFTLSALLVWVAQFHDFRDFGLYEDDYFFIAQAMSRDPSYLLDRFRAFSSLPQGRPLGFFMPYLLAFVGDKLGGLSGIYLLGFLVVTLNTFLCYRLLRARLSVAPSSVGAAVLCLFPADTTKILLTHDFQLQPSLTFALLAALAYGAGRRSLAYAVSAGALLSYESGFLALFALPLLFRRWDRSLARELTRHVLALLGVLFVVLVVRLIAGEDRATGTARSVTDMLPKVLGSLVLGPARSVAAMAYGPFKALVTWDVETITLVLLVFLTFGVLLWRSQRGFQTWSEVAQIGGAGAAMLILGYALAFTHFPPTAVVGRGTSVHLGATLGMAVLAAAVASGVLRLQPRVGAALLTAYVALAVGYYVTIDRDFMRSWREQRAFWQQVAACCSDLQDGTVLLYEVNPGDETTFIGNNSWADPLVLGETFTFPSAWSNIPRLFSLTRWLDRVEPDGDGLRWWVPAASWNEHWEPLPEDNVILLRPSSETGKIERITGNIDVGNGRILRLKAPVAAEAWPPAQLYEPLLH